MDSIEATRAPPPSQPSSSSAIIIRAKQELERDAIMDAALKEMKWRLGPALKRARIKDRTIKMEDIQKWRKENYNMEKRPRKFNSWVANKAKEEYQADLFFFDDLKQGDDEPAKYSAGLLGRRHLQQEDRGGSNRRINSCNLTPRAGTSV